MQAVHLRQVCLPDFQDGFQCILLGLQVRMDTALDGSVQLPEEARHRGWFGGMARLHHSGVSTACISVLRWHSAPVPDPVGDVGLCGPGPRMRAISSSLPPQPTADWWRLPHGYGTSRLAPPGTPGPRAVLRLCTSARAAPAAYTIPYSAFNPTLAKQSPSPLP